MVAPRFLPASDGALEVDGAATLSSKINEVTVYADRVRVVRSAVAALPAETGRQGIAEVGGRAGSQGNEGIALGVRLGLPG